SAAVAVCGGIQPEILRRALGKEHRESGLAARILLAFPPRKPKQFTENEVHKMTELEIDKLFDSLFELDFDYSTNEPKPVYIGMTKDAQATYRDFYNRHNREQAELSGDLAACWSKLE